MLTKTRQKLARFRQRGSPLASLVDFSLWSLRSVINPRLKSFWFIGLISALFVAAWFLMPYPVYIAAGFVVFLLLTLLTLVLSYLRSISRSHTHALGLARQEIGGSLTDIRKEQIAAAAKQESLLNDRFAEAKRSMKASSDSLETELDMLGNRLVDLAQELRALRSHSSQSAQQLAGMQDSLEKKLTTLETGVSLPSGTTNSSGENGPTDLAEIVSDVTALKNRLDNQVKNEAKTTQNLSDAINSLKTQLAEIKKAK
tara:strand:- start:475 stop:1245 length:771 start_codon:yes stop_codon:yes gene_type:complete